MPRKSFSVTALTTKLNVVLQHSAPELTGVRQGVINVLDFVLHESGNYKGFRFLLKDEVEGLPGVNYLDGQPHPDIELRFANTDKTRVQYF